MPISVLVLVMNLTLAAFDSDPDTTGESIQMTMVSLLVPLLVLNMASGTV